MSKRAIGMVLAGVAATVAGLMIARTSTAQEKPRQRVFEMRTYVAHEGKFEAMHARFRNHAVRLFKKHGMEMVGFWVPTDTEKSKNTMIYILAFDSADAMKEKWDTFRKDPEWQQIKTESEKEGPLVAKVTVELMTPTDYSPMK